MTVIYLIRHGQASFGQDRYDRLSDLGARQGRLLGAYFCRTGVRFEHAYSGSLDRQTATARATLSELPAPSADGLVVLREFDEFAVYSAWMDQLAELTSADPRLAEAAAAMFADPKAFAQVSERLRERWRPDTDMSAAGAAWKAFRAQVVAGLERVRDETPPGGRAAVFTSGGTISAALQHALGLDDERTLGLARQTRNTSFSTLLSGEKGFRLASYNAVPHLELENDASLITVI